MDLTRYTLDQIIKMLEDRGYNETSQDILSVKYVSCYNGQVKYKIEFEDGDGIDEGYVYIFIENGRLVCDY